MNKEEETLFQESKTIKTTGGEGVTPDTTFPPLDLHDLIPISALTCMSHAVEITCGPASGLGDGNHLRQHPAGPNWHKRAGFSWSQ